MSSLARQAKALVVFTKIPVALIPRLPAHAKVLEPFASMKAFHTAFPVGRKMDGTEIPPDSKADAPIFAAESLDKLVSDILLPVMLGKKTAALVGYNTPLAVPFIKDLLPELEHLYKMEMAAINAKQAAGKTNDDVDGAMCSGVAEEEFVSEQEGQELKAAFDKAIGTAYGEMAAEYVARTVMLVTWRQSVLSTISEQPMMKDGTARLWSFNAGLDATKNPNKSISTWRMKAAIDEDHWACAFDTIVKSLGQADTAIVLSGRNSLFLKEVKKNFGDVKPKVGVKELEIEPDEGQVAKLLRLESNSYGSVDLSEKYLQVVKDPKAWRSRRSEERRFVGGNTAFRKMSNTPVLLKQSMTTVTFAEREKVFKGVMGSERFSRSTPSKSSTGQGLADDQETDEDAEQEATETADVVKSSDEVVFFWMELHPRVRDVKGRGPGASAQSPANRHFPPNVSLGFVNFTASGC